MMKTLVLFLVFALSSWVPVFSQSENHDSRKSKRESNTDESEYKIGKNNLMAGFSVAMNPDLEGGSGVLFVMGGFEKTFGPLSEGYFFAGEIRARAGMLIDGKSDYGILTGSLNSKMKYSGNLAGISVAFRPAMEISETEKIFLYLEGELGLMYEYITTQIKGNSSGIIQRNAGGYIVPQYGVRLGLRSGKLSVFAGFYHFNHTTAVNRLVPKEYKVVNSREGIGGEIGFGFYF
jgi:hypothetical protein